MYARRVEKIRNQASSKKQKFLLKTYIQLGSLLTRTALEASRDKIFEKTASKASRARSALLEEKFEGLMRERTETVTLFRTMNAELSVINLRRRKRNEAIVMSEQKIDYGQKSWKRQVVWDPRLKQQIESRTTSTTTRNRYCQSLRLPSPGIEKLGGRLLDTLPVIVYSSCPFLESF